MKKFVIAIFTALLLCGCEGPKKSAVVKTDDTQASAIFDEIIEFEYRGHYWIWFKEYEGRYLGYSGGICHDPDCWCLSEDDIDYE